MLKFCANISWLFREVPFLERPAAARRAGFTGIEFHSPEDQAPNEIARAARDAGVGIVLFNAWPGDFLAGGLGLSGVPGREAEFRKVIAQARDFGAALGGGFVQIGQSRVPAGVSRDECVKVYLENLRHAAAELAKSGCRPLIEPMNAADFPGVLIADVQSGLSAIADAKDERIGLQFDAYHHHMSGGSVLDAIGTHAARISHLQFSDAPGRQEPGTGRIDVQAMLQALEREGYPNWVSAEYRPSKPTTQTLDWMSKT